MFAWTVQPTVRQARMAGIGKNSNTVIKFTTNASFEIDRGNIGKSISNVVVQTTDAQLIPFNISNVSIVDFRKEWWQLWKK